MSSNAFNILYELVTTHGEGWQDALRDAWFGGCLDEDQKNLLEAAL